MPGRPLAGKPGKGKGVKQYGKPLAGKPGKGKAKAVSKAGEIRIPKPVKKRAR